MGTLMKILQIVRARELRAKGQNREEISNALDISLATVKRYLANS